MPPRKAFRCSTKPRGPPRQAARARPACDICVRTCFIGSMLMVMIPGIGSVSVCNECRDHFSRHTVQVRNQNSRSMWGILFDQEARLRQAQREEMEVLERLGAARRRSKELEELLKMDGETERAWWSTPLNEQSPNELIVSMTAMKKLMEELDEHLAERAAASSSTAMAAATRPSGN